MNFYFDWRIHFNFDFFFSGYNVGIVSPLQFFTDSVKRVFGSSYMILSSKSSNWVLINLSFNE